MYTTYIESYPLPAGRGATYFISSIRQKCTCICCLVRSHSYRHIFIYRGCKYCDGRCRCMYAYLGGALVSFFLLGTILFFSFFPFMQIDGRLPASSTCARFDYIWSGGSGAMLIGRNDRNDAAGILAAALAM